MTGSAGVVVVGGGIAALQTIQELRNRGYTGRITQIADEDEPPYDRPPLSKGRDGVTASLLPIDLTAADVDRVLGRAVALDGADRLAQGPLAVTVEADSGPPQRLPAEYVVVATGAHAVLPPDWADVPGVHTLRTRSDAQEMWNALDAGVPPVEVLVIGASWIGMEFASVAASQGMHVTVLERASNVLPLVPPEIGRAVAAWAEQAGVRLVLGSSVETVRAAQTGVEVTTASGTLRTDFVLAALGVRPTTSWLAESGLPLGPTGALRVDEHLRSADHRVLGVGDAVERWSPRYQAWLPGGHWQDARDQGAVAADVILAEENGDKEPPGSGYDAVPYFWSEMFGHTLLWAGRAPSTPPMPRMVVRGSLHSETWTVCWLDEVDRLVAIMATGKPRDVVAARKAMAADPAGAPKVDPVCLSDASRPMRECFG